MKRYPEAGLSTCITCYWLVHSGRATWKQVFDNHQDSVLSQPRSNARHGDVGRTLAPKACADGGGKAAACRWTRIAQQGAGLSFQALDRQRVLHLPSKDLLRPLEHTVEVFLIGKPDPQVRRNNQQSSRCVVSGGEGASHKSNRSLLILDLAFELSHAPDFSQQQSAQQWKHNGHKKVYPGGLRAEFREPRTPGHHACCNRRSREDQERHVGKVPEVSLRPAGKTRAICRPHGLRSISIQSHCFLPRIHTAGQPRFADHALCRAQCLSEGIPSSFRSIGVIARAEGKFANQKPHHASRRAMVVGASSAE